MSVAGHVTLGNRMLVLLVLLSRLDPSWPRGTDRPVELTSSPAPTTLNLTTQDGGDATPTAAGRPPEVATLNGTEAVLAADDDDNATSDTTTTTTTTTQEPSSRACGGASSPEGGVFLTVSSLAETSASGHVTERRLQLNWHGFGGDPGHDTVALFDRDPTVAGPSVPLDQARVSLHPRGYFTTYVQFPRVTFEPGNLTSRCLGYWAAYLRDGVDVLSVSCLRARPTWMQDLAEDVGPLTLGQLMIPGTHDSGSYMPYLGKKSENVLIRYVYAQEESVFNQLAYGIRCLDLRVGFYNKTKEKFWINHSYFKTTNPLSAVVRDIKRFLDSAPFEIVVLDFHRFPVGFDRNPTAHKMLIEYLVKELGPYLIPHVYNTEVRLSELWSAKRRLLAAYNSKQRNHHPLLWSGIRQYWGDKQTVEQLLTYFRATFQGNLPRGLWSAMAELTPTSSDILRQPKRGLRILADEVNWQLTNWFRDLWADTANVVATDYFLGNNIVEVAVQANRRKNCLRAEGREE